MAEESFYEQIGSVTFCYGKQMRSLLQSRMVIDASVMSDISLTGNVHVALRGRLDDLRGDLERIFDTYDLPDAVGRPMLKFWSRVWPRFIKGLGRSWEEETRGYGLLEELIEQREGKIGSMVTGYSADLGGYVVEKLFKKP